MDESLRGHVSILPITQATKAIFADLYFRRTCLIFIQAGSKRVLNAAQGELNGEEGDLLIFPPDSMVTMENRPLRDDSYRAVGVTFSDDFVESVFPGNTVSKAAGLIQHVPAHPHRPMDLLPIIRETMDNPTLPDPIRHHRLLEALVWLKHHGYTLATPRDETPLGRVRRLIEADLAHPWRASEVANHLAMSEATMRRWLSRTGQGFSKIVLHTRLEQGLSQLQTTDLSISEIALDCGFKTPSHFSDAFKKRFGIRPREVRTPGR